MVYIAQGDPQRLLDDISVVEGWRSAMASGAARVQPIDPASPALDPHRQVSHYALATEEALAQGYAGLRVAADSTPLVLTPDGLEAFARYEHLADRYMVSHPFTGLCAFNRAVLGADKIAQLACLHPESSPQATPLRLHASADPGFTAVLAGEVDIAGHELLALRRAGLGEHGDPVVIDATELEFIDHRGLHLLSTVTSRGGAPTVVRCRRDSPLATLGQLLKPALRLELI